MGEKQEGFIGALTLANDSGRLTLALYGGAPSTRRVGRNRALGARSIKRSEGSRSRQLLRHGQDVTQDFVRALLRNKMTAIRDRAPVHILGYRFDHLSKLNALSFLPSERHHRHSNLFLGYPTPSRPSLRRLWAPANDQEDLRLARFNSTRLRPPGWSRCR